MKRDFRALALAFLISTGAMAHAELSLPDLFSDGMVLQQQTDAKLWGRCSPGREVTATTSWSDQKVSTKADKTGRWELTVATPEASFAPQQVAISGDGAEVVISDVLIGEVWLCGGQSNMEMPLSGWSEQPVEGGAQAIAYSAKYPMIRMASVERTGAYEPKERAGGKWKVSHPTNAPDFSAVAYFFARSLTDILGVPVGIINCSYGGTKIESWLPREIVDTYPDIDVEGEKNGTVADSDWHLACKRYYSMVHPIAGYTIKGFVWYQGESNVGKTGTYSLRMADMSKLWREKWGEGDLPFIMVEITPWSYGDSEGIAAALLREQQHMAAAEIPNCRIISTADLMYPYEVETIHPSRKQPIGERLSFMAAATTYDMPAIPHRYPRLAGVKLEGKKAQLQIENLENYPAAAEALEGFEVAGADKAFHPASATYDRQNGGIVVAAPCEVDEIRFVRYCFKNFALGNVRNKDGLPLIPFRTDK